MYAHKKERELDMKRCNEMFRGGGNLGEKTVLEASKSVTCRHSVLKLLLARNCHSYCCRRYEFRSSLPELATRPQFRNADLHKKSAFTLAEVLITLGIIGVVAALTLPSVIQNYQEKQLTTAWKKAYSDVANATLLMSQNNEDLSTEQKVGEAFARYLQIDKVCEAHKGIKQGCWRRGVYIYEKGGVMVYSAPTAYGGGAVCMLLTSGTTFCVDSVANKSILYFDVNGINKPNTYGKDIFFAIFNHEKYAIKPAKGRLLNWGAADCYWVTCTYGNGTCDGDDFGYGCSAEKLLK